MNLSNLLIAALVLVLAFSTIMVLQAESVEEIVAGWERSGHADRSSESFVHWDNDEPPLIPANCAKCHSLYGYLDYLGVDGTEAFSVQSEAKTGSVVTCYACHNEAIPELETAVFPSGVEVTDLGPEVACMQCHRGTRSGLDVQEAIADLPLDEASGELRFINVHYRVAAATNMGRVVEGPYLYDGQTYLGRFLHEEYAQVCVDCHDPHGLRIAPASCAPCHLQVVDFGDLRGIRVGNTDYDGDGDADEGIAREIETMHKRLYEAIQRYAGETAGQPIVYGPGSFPYFFIDTDADGQADEDETIFPNQYDAWTPRLVRTTYNYHYVQEDPGAFVHNGRYVLQFLYDSLADLGQVIPVDMEGMVRP